MQTLKLKLLVVALSFIVQAVSAIDERSPITVAQDGTGDFTSIQAAINSCRAFQTFEKIIYIKKGVYKEKLLLDSYLTHIHLIGEDPVNTIITFDDFAGRENMGTFKTYTLKITGDDIWLENLTIENSAGEVGQAVALHVEGDRCIFKNCRLLGNQDTLYAAGAKSRQYFINCYIEGTTDFIFGASVALFDGCTIFSKSNSFVTAANTPQNNSFGYVFKNCILKAAPEVNKVYLGRPWRDFARVVFLDCEMGTHILPEGWHNWDQPEREKTSFYAEYRSKGDGGNSSMRVAWSHQLNAKQAKMYKPENIFKFPGNSWMPVQNK